MRGILKNKINYKIMIAAIISSAFITNTIYVYVFQLPIFSRRIIAITLAVFSIITLCLYFFIHSVILNRLNNLPKPVLNIIAAFSLFLSFLVFIIAYKMDFSLKFNYLFLPKHSLSIQANAVGDAGGTLDDRVEIVWINNGIADVSFNALDLQGEWHQTETSIYTDQVGKAGYDGWSTKMTVQFQKQPNAGTAEIIFDGERKIIDLRSEYQEKTEVVFYSPAGKLNYLFSTLPAFFACFAIAFSLLVYPLQKINEVVWSSEKIRDFLELLTKRYIKNYLLIILIVFFTSFSVFLFFRIKGINDRIPINELSRIYDPSELIFLVILLVLSIASGLLTAGLSKNLDINILPCFIIGFCLAPFLLSYWMLFASYIFPGDPISFFVATPPIVSTVIILKLRTRLKKIFKLIMDVLHASRKNAINLIVLLLVVVILSLLTTYFVTNGRGFFTLQDAMVYRANALHFAETRSFQSIPPLEGFADGSLPRSSHNFIYPAYLSYSMLINNGSPLGYPNDLSVNDAHQILVIYVILALVGLSMLTENIHAPILSFILITSVGFLGSQSYRGSRDVFTAIPIILLITLFLGIPAKKTSAKIGLPALLLVSILANASLGGHTIGGLFAVMIVLAMIVQSFITRESDFVKVFLISIVAGIGLLVGSRFYIQSIMTYGTLRYTAIGATFNGTVLEGIRNLLLLNESIDSADYAGRLERFLSGDNMLLTVSMIAAVLYLFFNWDRNKKNAINGKRISMFLLFLALPFTGLLDIKVFGISELLLDNKRYIRAIYPIAVASLVFILFDHMDSIFSYKRNINKYKKQITIKFILLFMCVFSFISITQWDKINPLKTVEHSHNSIIGEIKKQQLLNEDDSIVLTDLFFWSYYFNNKNIQLMFFPISRDIYKTQSDEELYKLLKEGSIKFIAVRKSMMKRYWQYTQLESFLQNRLYSDSLFSNDSMDVYVIK